MSSDPRETVAAAARELVRSLVDLPDPPTTRVAEVEGRVACLILVWDAARAMPTVGSELRRRAAGGRKECRADIIELFQATGRPLTRKEVVKELRVAGKAHGASTVAKALAELTAAGELVNPRDHKGYRPRGWRPCRTPPLF